MTRLSVSLYLGFVPCRVLASVPFNEKHPVIELCTFELRRCVLSVYVKEAKITVGGLQFLFTSIGFILAGFVTVFVTQTLFSFIWFFVQVSKMDNSQFCSSWKHLGKNSHCNILF